MEVLTTTPFGRRPLTATLVENARVAQGEASIPHINKWEIFRELTVARVAFGLTDRDLAVLNALLSFHPETNLSDNDRLIVFPSNRSLSERAHGMAESTLRRHLAALVQSGLLQRHDSPNGKRYAARGENGEMARAFGFDLRPLLVRGQKIVLAASEARAAAERLRRLREDVSLLKRDAIKLVAYGEETATGGDWAPLQTRLLEAHKASRRSLNLDELDALRLELATLLTSIKAQFINNTDKMDGNGVQSERHYPNSNTDTHESELCLENAKEADRSQTDKEPSANQDPDTREPRIPLALVLKACPDLLPYASDKIVGWEQLHQTACFVRGMMGISPDAWQEAQHAMGPENAATTLACILQRVADIQSPGGYLRALTRKAQDQAFSPGPMVMALLNIDRPRKAH